MKITIREIKHNREKNIIVIITKSERTMTKKHILVALNATVNCIQYSHRRVVTLWIYREYRESIFSANARALYEFIRDRKRKKVPVINNRKFFFHKFRRVACAKHNETYTRNIEWLWGGRLPFILLSMPRIHSFIQLFFVWRRN